MPIEPAQTKVQGHDTSVLLSSIQGIGFGVECCLKVIKMIVYSFESWQ